MLPMRSSLGKLNRIYRSTHHRLFTSTTNQNAFKGVWPIIATPFNEDESINYKSFEKIIDFYSNEVGVNGCTIIGVLGESNRLIDDERKQLIQIATSISSKPICVGTSHAGTMATVKLSEQAMERGAHSVMITPSREAVPDQLNNIINYYGNIYRHLGDAVPIVLQDHPASTMVHISMESMKHIIQQCPSVHCIKLESLPSPPKIRHLVPFIEQNKLNCTILTGLGALYGLFDLECNSDGFMTGFAFPEILYELYRQQVVLKDNACAKLLYQRFLPLMVFEQQPGVAIRKEIYRLRGLMECTKVRHPGKGTTEDAVKQLRDWIEFVFDAKNVDLTKKLDLSHFQESTLKN